MIRVVALLLALSGVALADPASAYYVARPPAQFDHTFRGPTTIRFLTLDQLAHLCGGPALGCTAIGGARCDINIAHIGQDAELIRHERAHCNGWAAWHPALAARNPLRHWHWYALWRVAP